VKLKIRVFVKILMLGKQNSTIFYIFTIIVARFTEINISDNKLGKYYFNILAELYKYGFRCSASSLSALN